MPEDKETQDVQKEPQETPKDEDQGEDLKARADAMYAKYKSAKEEKEAIEAKLAEQEKQLKALQEKASKDVSSGQVPFDPRAIAEYDIATEGLTSEEKSKLIEEAELRGQGLKDVRQSDDFSFWLNGHRQKVEEEKKAPPSTAQGKDKGSKKLEEMTLPEKEAYFRDRGWVPDFRRPDHTQQ